MDNIKIESLANFLFFERVGAPAYLALLFFLDATSRLKSFSDGLMEHPPVPNQPDKSFGQEVYVWAGLLYEPTVGRAYYVCGLGIANEIIGRSSKT